MDGSSDTGSFLDNLGIGDALSSVASDTISSVAQSAGDFISNHVSQATAVAGAAPTGNLTAAQIAAGQTGQAAGSAIHPSGALSFLTNPKKGGLLIPALLIVGAVYFLKGRH